MKKSQLLTLLRSFSKKEIRDLRKWLQSPYHFQREDGLQLFEYLIAHQQEDLEKETVYAAIFGQPYNDARMRQIIHFLKQAVADFLTFEARRDPVREAVAYAAVLRERELLAEASRVLQRAGRLHEGGTLQNADRLETGFLLSRELYDTDARQRTGAYSIEPVIEQQELVFLTRRYRMACVRISQSRPDTPDQRLEAVETLLSSYPDSERPFALQFYHTLYHAYADENDDRFRKFLGLLAEHSIIFPDHELRDLYLLAINFCIRRIHAGQRDYRSTMFNLYKRGLKKDVLLENGEISPFAFKNIVTLGLDARDYVWTEQFIQTYRHRLPNPYREQTPDFDLANLYYQQGEYERARQQIPITYFRDPKLNLVARTLLIKIYFHLEEFAVLESHLESTRTYLRRQKLDPPRRAMYKNLISCTKQLLRLASYRSGAAQRLRKRVQELPLLAERDWLLRMLGDTR